MTQNYFSDVDECSGNDDPCDDNAECVNTISSFRCVCDSGYTGNGIFCESKNVFVCYIILIRQS